MEPWLITLLIIFSAYILLIITDLIFVFSFKTILRKHNNSLSVILTTKYDNIKKIVELFSKYNVHLDEELIEQLDQLNPSVFAKQHSVECKKARELLSRIRSDINYIMTSNSSIEKHAEFILAMENVKELDDVYRMNIAMFNADVLGYNYWIRFLPCRYIFSIFKVKTKELIS
jgi:hypothetical protein